MQGESDRGSKRQTESERTANDYRLRETRLGREAVSFSMVPTRPVWGRGFWVGSAVGNLRGWVLSADQPRGLLSIAANVNIEHLSAAVKKPIWILAPPNRTTRRSRPAPLVLKRTSTAGTKKRVAPDEQLDRHVRLVRTMRGPRYKTPDAGNPNNRACGRQSYISVVSCLAVQATAFANMRRKLGWRKSVGCPRVVEKTRPPR